MSSQAKTFITPEEYLALDSAAEFRSEYLNGEMFAKAGGSFEHAGIIDNLQAGLNAGLGGSGCRARTSNLRVFIPATGLYTYPDVLVTCGQPLFQGKGRETLLNPVLLAEVLSPSTERYDRGEKFKHFRSIPTLREYLLVSADKPQVEQFVRQDQDHWLLSEYSSLAAVVSIQVAVCEVPLSKIYEEVQF